ncbi:MaoC family dehydratase [Sneathiella sp.]|jgi:acyl dehydratase|uniref:MaoC family dehydratase n=1 Tax=Sneathiella sp. TaxID=1964365 RepID=UPI0039E3CEC5
MTKTYWEDFPVGREDTFGHRIVDEDEIIEFATEFDPQLFHIDKDLAKDHFFGGIIASGWHTGAMLMRLIVDNLLQGSTSVGSPGIEQLRWKAPVRPDDILSAHSVVLEATVHKKKPDRGFTKFQYTVFNQHNEVKMTMVSTIIFLRRPETVVPS